MPKSRPGEYISVQTHIPSLGHKQSRQYSLSDIDDGKYLRVSVRRDELDLSRPGLVSNALHKLSEGDKVEVSSPKGDFHLIATDDGKSPLVLLAAGIGQTPLYSILRAALSSNAGRPVTYVRVVKNSSSDAFKKELDAFENTDRLTRRVFHTRPKDSEREGVDYDFTGRPSLEMIKNDLHLDSSAQY